jgi:hypothetical protein
MSCAGGPDCTKCAAAKVAGFPRTLDCLVEKDRCLSGKKISKIGVLFCKKEPKNFVNSRLRISFLAQMMIFASFCKKKALSIII